MHLKEESKLGSQHEQPIQPGQNSSVAKLAPSENSNTSNFLSAKDARSAIVTNKSGTLDEIEASNLPHQDHDSNNRQFYDEFLNCTTNNYNIQEKEDTEEISSNGEFDEFKDPMTIAEDDEFFIEKKYMELLVEKYVNSTHDVPQA
jgi:hypothetical protein